MVEVELSEFMIGVLIGGTAVIAGAVFAGFDRYLRHRNRKIAGRGLDGGALTPPLQSSS